MAIRIKILKDKKPVIGAFIHIKIKRKFSFSVMGMKIFYKKYVIKTNSYGISIIEIKNFRGDINIEIEGIVYNKYVLLSEGTNIIHV